MTTTSLRIKIDRDPSGLHFARSPDMPELNAASRSLGGLQVAIREIVEAHFDIVHGRQVTAEKKSGDDRNQVWLVAPKLNAAADR